MTMKLVCVKTYQSDWYVWLTDTFGYCWQMLIIAMTALQFWMMKVSMSLLNFLDVPIKMF